MQSSKERRTNRGEFGWIYKVFCQEKSVKPLPSVQACLQRNCLRFCADRVTLKDWSPIFNAIAKNRSLSRISIYSRSRRRKVREKINTEEKLVKLRRCGGKDQTWPIIYTNFLLRCLVDSLAVFVSGSSTITSISLDGFPLSSKYLNILCSGLASNRCLKNLSLAKCRIEDTGCDSLLGSLRSNFNLCVLNLSSCRLTNRSALCLSIFLKSRKTSLLQDAWEEPRLKSHEKEHQGLEILILNRNHKFGDNGIRELMHTLKSDFWMKSLSLRGCGITKYGGEVIVELLQVNSVLAKMDLTENDIPCNILRIVSKILKRRHEKGERISLKRRLPNWRNMTSRNACERTRNCMSNRVKQLATRRDKKHSLECYEFKKIEDRRKRMICKTKKKTWKKKNVQFNDRIDLCALESQLLDVTNQNFTLKKQLMNNKRLLEAVIHGRLRAEKDCKKIIPRLNDLKSRIIILSCLRAKVYGESQFLKSLHDVFENLETHLAVKQPTIINNPMNGNIFIREKQRSLLPKIKQRNKLTNCTQRLYSVPV